MQKEKKTQTHTHTTHTQTHTLTPTHTNTHTHAQTHTHTAPHLCIFLRHVLEPRLHRLQLPIHLLHVGEQRVAVGEELSAREVEVTQLLSRGQLRTSHVDFVCNGDGRTWRRALLSDAMRQSKQAKQSKGSNRTCVCVCVCV